MQINRQLSITSEAPRSRCTAGCCGAVFTFAISILAECSAAQSTLPTLNNGFSERDNFDLWAVCRLTDISENVLWQKGSLVSAPRSGNANTPTDDARRQHWNRAVAELERLVNPQHMYPNWYYHGLGQSLLSTAGEEISRQTQVD